MRSIWTLTPLLLVAPATAQAPLTPQQVLTRLFSEPLQAEWFTPELLTRAPLGFWQAQTQALRQSYGPLVRVEPGESPRLIFERGTLLVTGLGLDEQGRLTRLTVAPLREREVLGKLFAAAPIDTSLFSAEFLQAVPAEALRQLFGELRAQLGEFQGAEATPRGWSLSFARGRVPVLGLELNEAGQITGFRIGGTIPYFKDVTEAQAAFAALPGKVSLLVREVGGAPLLSLRAKEPLAVGSAFKLAVLAELQAQINAGKHTWTQQLMLTDAVKSLPSGTLQDAPAGRYSLRDLADRMIRDSDNTAADLLLDFVGRDAVARRLGQRVMPSTREAFVLKAPANTALLQAYRAGLTSAARQKAVLAQAAAAPLPAVDAFMTGPLALDVEWFVSAERLCSLMNEVAAQPSTQLNPGVASSSDFAKVSHKGGSEPGVLNLTTEVTTKAGKSYCVSATWNHSRPLEEETFVGLYAGLLELLR